jgi:hypothetical protein
LALKFRRGDIHAEFLFDRENQLNRFHRIQDFAVIERQIGVGVDLFYSADRSEELQYFVRQISSHHKSGSAVSQRRRSRKYALSGSWDASVKEVIKNTIAKHPAFSSKVTWLAFKKNRILIMILKVNQSKVISRHRTR